MEDKRLISIEDALKEKEELLSKLNDYNNMIFENNEEANTEEFSKAYQALQEKLEEVEIYLEKNHYKEKVETDSIINKAPLWIWPYMIVLILASFYPIFKNIDISIIMIFISLEQVANMTPTNQIIVIVCSFLILPASLLLLNIVPNFFFKKAETKKVYFYLSVVFWISLFIASVVTCIKFVILPFVQ